MIGRNVLYNLVGHALPLAVAIVAIPRLIEGLGPERFGLLSLMWMVLGYFSVFDLGLGRALTQQVSTRRADGNGAEAESVAWTGLVMMLALGAAGGLAMLLGSAVIGRLWHVPPPLIEEAVAAFRLVAVSLPAVIVTTGLRGILEAHHRFSEVNLVRIPMGVYTFLAPLFALNFEEPLLAVAAILAAGRFVGCGAHVGLCLRLMPDLLRATRWSSTRAWALLRAGGWMTISNIVNPVMVSLDRFLIASLVSVSAVTYYSTPYEAVTKIWMIPAALGGVFFPAFAGTFFRDSAKTRALYWRGMSWSVLLLLPLCLTAGICARPALELWLGTEFAHRSTVVLRWLAAGVFFSSLAGIPFALIQAAGRPDLTALLHLVQLPFYVAGLWVAIRYWGVEGAAAAWTIRMSLDALALAVVSARLLDTSGSPAPSAATQEAVDA